MALEFVDGGLDGDLPHVDVPLEPARRQELHFLEPHKVVHLPPVPKPVQPHLEQKGSYLRLVNFCIIQL